MPPPFWLFALPKFGTLLVPRSWALCLSVSRASGGLFSSAAPEPFVSCHRQCAVSCATCHRVLAAPLGTRSRQGGCLPGISPSCSLSALPSVLAGGELSWFCSVFACTVNLQFASKAVSHHLQGLDGVVFLLLLKRGMDWKSETLGRCGAWEGLGQRTSAGVVCRDTGADDSLSKLSWCLVPSWPLWMWQEAVKGVWRPGQKYGKGGFKNARRWATLRQPGTPPGFYGRVRWEGRERCPWRTGGRLETAPVVGGVLPWVFRADLVFLVKQGLLPAHLVCGAGLHQIASPSLAHYPNYSMLFPVRAGRGGREEGSSCHLSVGCPAKPRLLFHVMASHLCLPQGALLGPRADHADCVLR